MNRFYLSAIFLALVTTAKGASLDYSDLQAEGVFCPEKHSCTFMSRSSARPKFKDRNCECDRNCSLYNDCCIDSPRLPTGYGIPRNPSMTCMSFNGSDGTGAFMVNRCRRDYAGPARLKRLCEQGGVADPLMAVPATDAASGVTYSSRYCAECNGVMLKDLSSWLIRVSCEENLMRRDNVSEEYIFSNLKYSASNRSWGVDHWDRDKMAFFVCDILSDLPRHLARHVRLCRPKVVSDCPKTWRRVSVKRKCDSYTAVVYYVNVAYKNPHCAICNNVSASFMLCVRTLSPRSKQALSFALLLDVNTRDGEEVGRTRLATPSCSGNRVYDPFFKGCRRLVCALPGFRPVDGRCVRI